MSPDKPELTWKKIATFWLPLYSTWLMMSIEGSFIAAIIARLAGYPGRGQRKVVRQFLSLAFRQKIKKAQLALSKS